jgi:hypothetical protein
MPGDFMTMAGMKKHPYMYAAGFGAGPLALAGMSNWGGKPGRVIQAPTQTAQGQGLLSHLMSQGLENTNFANTENRARNMFQTSTVPSLAERFTNMGSGAQRSSAFNSAIFGAGSDLESQLAQLRDEYGMQQAQLGLTPQFENIYQPGRPSFLQQLLSALGNIGGQAAKGYMGGM